MVRVVRRVMPIDGLLRTVSARCETLGTSIYDSVEGFERLFDTLEAQLEEADESVSLRDIINLHNATGIKSLAQIVGLTQAMNTHSSSTPPPWVSNVKIVISKRDEWVLFDGHHTMLAFMKVGKVYLHEVPYTLVCDFAGNVSDEEISTFFGEHGKRIDDWRPYTINWQAPEASQLESRIQDNMGELIDSLRPESSDSAAGPLEWFGSGVC